MSRRIRTLTGVAVLVIAAVAARGTDSQPETVVIRGQPIPVRTYGPRGGDPIVLSSGDGGWIHLAPHVAEVLAGRGYFVVGLDARHYLERFTSGDAALRPDEVPADFREVVRLATPDPSRKPILIGVSEGAGLSVLAAADPRMQDAIGGVVCLGLSAVNELGWRWKDAVIYVTHGIPHEPTFRTAEFIDRVAPLPLAAIHSTHDEYSSVADVGQLMNAARAPKRLWMVNATDHRFSNNLAEFDARLLDAITWIRANGR
jgi:pimeloyl-ACP methyl ester carboxylesterase